MLFTLAEIVETTSGRAESVTADGVGSVSIDSRSLEAGALYVAIKGDRFDGHAFVKNAVENGAAAALVSKAKAPELTGLPLIIVNDPLQAMTDLARLARARSEAHIIAVTGSVGKTTTKEALRHVLSQFGPTHASIKSYNNHWGVPLMLANLPKNAAFGIFEIGMNHAGEITPLSKLVQPEIAVITSVAPAHIAQLGSLEAIAKAKAEIFDGLVANGTAIVNVDHAQSDFLIEAARAAGVGEIVTYGFEASADVLVLDYVADGAGCSASIRMGDNEAAIKLEVSGSHMVANAAACLAVVDRLGLDVETAVNALRTFSAPKGRGTIVRLGPQKRPLTLIDQSYNANPSSMRAALEVFGTHEASAGGRKVLVLGDMLELGAHAAPLHAGLDEMVLASRPDLVFLVGSEMSALEPKLADKNLVVSRVERVDEIGETIINVLDYGDTIMLKGSLGVGLGSVVELIRHRFGQAE